MKTLTKIMLCASVLSLVACVGGNQGQSVPKSTTAKAVAASAESKAHSQVKQVPQGANPMVSVLAKIAFKQFMQSDFAKKTGIGKDSTAQSFEKMQAQLTELNGKIDQLLLTQMQTYIAVNQLSNYMQRMSLNDLNNSFMKMQNRSQTFYFAFNSAVQNQTGGEFFTWEQIADSQRIMTNLANGLGCGAGAGGQLSCATPINLMINDTLNIVGKGNQGGEIIGVSNFASQLFSAVQTYSLQGFPQAGTNNPNYNLALTMDRHNETVMAYLGQMINVLQQDSNILNTLLYLRYYAPSSAGFASISIPVPGFNSYNSYEQNKLALDTFFATQTETLRQNAQSYLISDNPLQPESAGIYKNAKTIGGMSGGNWTKSCNMYIWTGASNESNMGYKLANYTGAKITQALCYDNQSLAMGKFDLDIAASCDGKANTVNWYYGKNPNNQTIGVLQCNNFNSGYGNGRAPGWNSGAGYYDLVASSRGIYNKVGFNIYDSAASMGQLSGVYNAGQYNNQWGTDVGKIKGAIASNVFQYRTRDGLVAGFSNIIYTDKAYRTTFYWKTQIQCLNNEANCRQIAPLTLCIGNDKVRMSKFRAGNADAGSLLSYEGKCN